MHPVKAGSKRKRTVLVLVLALGVGRPPPAQAYLLDFTVASINPVVLISHAGGYPSRPPPAGSNLKVIDASGKGDLKRQLSPTIKPPKKNLNFQKGPLVDFCVIVPSATSAWMPGGTTLLTGPFETGSVTEATPEGRNSFLHLAGSSSTDNKDDASLASLGLQRQTAHGDFDPGLAASFASSRGAPAIAMVPSHTIFNHLAPFSSTLLLLGCGLMGLVGLRYRRRRG
jgi:hypothetical protein